MRDVTWERLLDECSRIHTTRKRPMGPWEGAPIREDAQMLKIAVIDAPAVVVPTRMHEPGFYVRSDGPDVPYWNFRTDDELRDFQAMVENGLVSER